MATVNLRSMTKSFGSVQVIHGIDLDIADGEFVVLVGPSGCGKSTLLRMIAGLESIDGGELTIGGREVSTVPPKARDIAMVFQNYALYPHMTVGENMGFALKLARVPKREASAKIERAAGSLGLTELLGRYPRQLSGGQRQRVAMGRTIVRDPAVFLFDEPLSNLDASLRVQMRLELAQLHRQLGTTMIYVTHDQVEAMTLAEKIAVLNGGRLEQAASPLDIYHRPRNLFVARFIGSPQINVIGARVVEVANGTARVALPDGVEFQMPGLEASVEPGEPVSIGIRPEALEPAGDGTIAGTVSHIEHLGGLTLLHVAYGATGTLAAQITGGNGWRVGEAIRFNPQSSGIHLFDAKGLRVAGGEH